VLDAWMATETERALGLWRHRRRERSGCLKQEVIPSPIRCYILYIVQVESIVEHSVHRYRSVSTLYESLSCN
jgi:hypothetical protein